MPTRITETSASIIDHIYYYEGINGKRDLTTTSGNLWCDVTDHLPNYFIISEKVKKATTDNDRPLIRLYSAKNMRHFQYMTANTEWGDIYATSSVNEAYSLFETKINGCYNASFPQVKLSRKRARDKKWMTPGLKICSKKKNKLYKRWVLTANECDGIRYKTYRKIYKKVLADAEQKYYREHFNTKTNSIKQLWSNLNHIFSFSKAKSRTSISKLIVNNTEVTTPRDICNCLNNYFCSVGENLAASIETGKTDFIRYCKPPITNSMYCEPITKNEIETITATFQDNKSPGPDNIGPKLLKSVLNCVADPLLYMFNLSFTSGCVPQSLKVAKVIPLFKKGDKSSPSNYRPISLLSIFDKLLEKLMHKRLYIFLSKNSILHQYQFGFRKNHSTCLALIELLDCLYSHIDQSDIVLGMYFDLQKAFDTVDHQILLYKLYNCGVRGTVYNWFRDYLSNRKQFVSLGNYVSELGSINYGVPQGSVLGPLLFLIYINDICCIDSDCTVKLFADDTNVFVFEKTLDGIFCSANIIVQQLNNWFIANKLSVSVDKTCYSTFGYISDNIDMQYVLKLHDQPIVRVEQCKYLGIIIDNKLTWKPHIDYVHSKLLKFTSIFYKLRWKLSSAVLRILYFAFVYPHLLYGVEVYGNCYRSHIDKLIILNNKLLRIIQNKPMKTHVSQLYRNFDTLPLPELHQFQLLCLVHKYLHCSNKLPAVFSNYFTLNQDVHDYNTRSTGNLHLTRVRTLRGARNIKFKASQLWNNIPDTLKSIQTVRMFKKCLKQYLLNNNS